MRIKWSELSNGVIFLSAWFNFYFDTKPDNFFIYCLLFLGIVSIFSAFEPKETSE